MDSNYVEVQVVVCPIWNNMFGNNKWLYVEQAVSSKPEAPYRQRIYELKFNGNNQYTIFNYKLPRVSGYSNACENLQVFDNLKPEDLFLIDGCNVELVKNKSSEYVGGTIDKQCKSDLIGTDYVVVQTVISATRFYSWDRGFKINEVQVWGPKDKGYTFLKH